MHNLLYGVEDVLESRDPMEFTEENSVYFGPTHIDFFQLRMKETIDAKKLPARKWRQSMQAVMNSD